ncbi:MAG TPA: TonB-dependent receptor [Candidatus Acidoferrales bacterium]|nr:TonB-dependent receptor [Candidatus Acidoferrales bacterium]
MKSIHVVLFLFVSLALASNVAYAQGVGASGDIKGTITDPLGGALPKVTVVVVETEKGFRRSTTSDDNGQYRVTGLPPATYDVSAELSGFQREVRKRVVVTVGETVILDFQLKVSQLTTQIEVTAETPIVETERSAQANTIEEQDIRNLPIDRRDYLTYTLLAPGVTDATSMADSTGSVIRVKQTPQSGLSFYGSNGRGNSVTVDGGEANDDSGGVLLTLSQDAVQEFQINRSNYSAELGSASGASINIVSKSGANTVHGSAFGFFRNDALDAQDPFAKTPALAKTDFSDFSLTAKGAPVKPTLSRQQFGGSVGFPIQKDKTFLFLAYEGLRRDESAPVPLLTDSSIFAPTSGLPGQSSNQVAVLSALQARGGTPVPCLTNPATTLPANMCAGVLSNILTVNPQSSALKAFWVKQFITNAGLFPFQATQDLGSARLDHMFSANNQVFLRYNYGRDIEQNPNVQALVGFSQGNQVSTPTSNTIVGAWFHEFSPQTQNEARAQFIYYKFDVVPNDPGGPQLEINGFGSFGRNIFLPSRTIAHRYEVADNFTFSRGRHKMKTGAYLLVRGDHTNSHTYFPGRFFFGDLPGQVLSPCLMTPPSGTNACGLSSGATVNGLQAAALGLPQSYIQGFGSGLIVDANPLIAGYWQDSWSLRSNLTLNYGVRYELDKRYAPLHTDTDNFAPRVSLAWDPFGNHKTVVRAGYGIFYASIYNQIDSVVRYLNVVDRNNGNQQVVDPVTNCASGTVDCFRQIPLVFSAFPGSAPIFQTLFKQGKIGCGTPPTGDEACITQDDLKNLFGINITHNGPIPPLSVIFGSDPDFQNAYSQQAELGIERELGQGFSISLSYIHSRTLKVTRARDSNLLDPSNFKTAACLAAGGTTCGDVPSGPAGIRIKRWDLCGAACFVHPSLLLGQQYESSGKAFYDGGIIEVNKRFGQLFSLFANYTFSKAIDDVTDFNSDFEANDQTNLAAERSLSPFDQRHKVVIAAVLESPWKGGASANLAARIFSGFMLSPIVRGNSARPFNLLTGTEVNGDRHSTTDRPPGAGRDTGIGPNFWTFDMRLTRQIGLGEKARLQLTAEGFNILNRTNLATVNNVVGVIGPPFNLHGSRDRQPNQPLGFTAAQPMRQIQLGLRLSF